MDKYDCSVNCLAWAPPQYGIILIAGLSSGNIAVIKYMANENQWNQQTIQAHKSSVNAISIDRFSINSIDNQKASGEGNQGEVPNLKFVSCSCDNQVYEWIFNNGEWKRNKVGFHDEWVRDVAYASPNVGINYQRIVSGGEDNKVKIWKKEGQDAEWELESEIDKEAPVWRVEFGPLGNLLSVCSGDNQTTVYKEKVVGGGEWIQDSMLNEEGVLKDK
mgnify:CR=1 FL=1